MRGFVGDVWTLHPQSYVVVPTNVGFKLADYTNPMKRGVALQAARKFPDLPARYGKHCIENGKRTRWVIWPDVSLVMFSTKPMDTEQPWFSWRQKASLSLIEENLRTLSHNNDTYWGIPMAFPMVGCGEGKLDMMVVGALMRKYLTADYYTVVVRKCDMPSEWPS